MEVGRMLKQNQAYGNIGDEVAAGELRDQVVFETLCVLHSKKLLREKGGKEYYVESENIYRLILAWLKIMETYPDSPYIATSPLGWATLDGEFDINALAVLIANRINTM